MHTFSTPFLKSLVAAMSWHIANNSAGIDHNYRASHARLAAELARRA